MRRGAVAIAAALLVCEGTGRAQAGFHASTYASGFSAPVAIVQDPTNRFVQFIVEQAGRIRVVRSGTRLDTDFLDLRSAIRSGGEQGLLGLAFSPDYPSTGRFFVNFTNQAGGHTVIARFRRSSDPLIADPGSRFDLRLGGAPFITQPFSNHNGGHLAFGPDGYLYIGLGDGGSGDDPAHRAQNPRELLGKMLRVDVNVPDTDAAGYRVPADNPFLGAGPSGTRPEIWSFGLRNPWRYTFDDPARGGTGALIIGDVGQGSFEEIDYEPARTGGRNYGWRNREGAHPNVTNLPPAFQPLVDPIFEYEHGPGASVTGGYVYRGTALGDAFRGRYLFADFVRGRIWSLALAIDAAGEALASDLRDHTVELRSPGPISSFGVDADGELFIVAYATGTVLRLLGPVPAPPPAPTGLRIIRP